MHAWQAALGVRLVALVGLVGTCGAAVGCGGSGGPRGGSVAATTNTPSAVALRAVPTSSLPRVGTIGDAPANAVEVAVDVAAGLEAKVYVEGREVAVGGLVDALKAALGTTADGAVDEDRDVVLRLPASLRWISALRVRTACRAAGAWRLHAAAVGEVDGGEGTLAWFLPTQVTEVLRPGDATDEPEALSVGLEPADVEAPDGAVFAALREAVAAAPTAPILLRAAGGLATGRVLRTVDLALRAGAPRVILDEVDLPKDEPLAASATVAGDALALPSRWVDGSLVAGPFPAIPRVERAAAGSPRADATDSVVLAIRGGRPRAARVSPSRRATDAVESALQWLASHQSPDGRWEAAGFLRWCDGQPVEAPTLDGAGDARRDVGVTGLALLAFLGAGYTNRSEGPLGKAVGRAAAWVSGQQDADGAIGARGDAGFGADHVLATLAMSELYGMTGSRRFAEPARRAVDLVRRAQLPSGAWPTNLEGTSPDDGLTFWAAFALLSPLAIDEADRQAGKPPPFGLDRGSVVDALAHLDGVLARGGDAPGLTLAPWGGRGTAASSPDGLLAGVTLLRASLVGDPRQHEGLRVAAERLASSPWRATPDGSATDIVRAYLTTAALFRVGGPSWAAWERSMATPAWRTQRLDGTSGDARGSWDPAGPGAADGGRVFMTALHVLVGEIWYRYDKVYGAR